MFKHCVAVLVLICTQLFYLLAIVLPRVPDRIVESMRSQLVDALGAVLSVSSWSLLLLSLLTRCAVSRYWKQRNFAHSYLEVPWPRAYRR